MKTLRLQLPDRTLCIVRTMPSLFPRFTGLKASATTPTLQLANCTGRRLDSYFLSGWFRHYLIMSATQKGKYSPVAQAEDKEKRSNVDSVHIPMEDDDEGADRKSFVASRGLTSAEAAKLLERWGRNELEEKNKPKVGSDFRISHTSFLSP